MSYDRAALQRLADDAADSFRLVADHAMSGVRYIEAEADTGTRYTVVVTELPPAAHTWTTAPLLVTVLSPWRIAYPVQRTGELHIGYVIEKLIPRGEANPGDAAALTMAVAHALGRRAVTR